MTEDKKPNVAEQTKKFFEDRIAAGYQVDDKNKVIDLVNEAMESLKIPRGSYGRTKKILNKVLIEKGIVTKGKGFEKKADSLEVSLEGEKAPEVPQTVQPETPKQNQFLGVENSPQAQDTQAEAQAELKPPMPPLTEGDLPRYKRKFGRLGGFVQKIYIKFGIMTEEERKKVEQDYQDLADDWAGYCIDNNIHLPKHIDFMLLMAQTMILIAAPLFKWIFKPKKKEEKKDEKTN